MVRVNKKYLSKELQAEAWGSFLKEVKSTESSGALTLSLKKFLTPSEITMLEKRLSIPILLKQKLSYRAIGAVLDVSQTTISFVKHNLTKAPVIHKKYSPNKEWKMKNPYAPRFKGGAKLF